MIDLAIALRRVIQALDLEHMRQWATHLQLDDDLEDLILAVESNR